MKAAAPPARWRFAWLYAAPHRLALAAGAFMLGVAALWWTTAMLARSQQHTMHFVLPPFHAHGLLMTFGFMPLFFTGFLFTAGPKWLGRPPVAARDLAVPLLAQLAGWAVFLLGVHGPGPAFGAVLGGMGIGPSRSAGRRRGGASSPCCAPAPG